MRLSRAILVFLLISSVGQLVYYYPNLPEQMAVHFNWMSEADRWSSKLSFMILEAIILLVIIAEWTLLPMFIERIPVTLINLPNKEYWLTQERRTMTFMVFRRYFEWFGVAMLTMLIAVNEMIFRANLLQQNLSNWIWLVLIAFIVYAGSLTVKLILSFKKIV